jgi:hypothetical protein
MAAGLVCLLSPHHAVAQTGGVAGTVARDAAGTVAAGAEVRLPLLNRAATTDDKGAFKIDGIEPGRYDVIVRLVGFTPIIDSIVVAAGQVSHRSFVFAVPVKALDTVRTNAAETKVRSTPLSAFEERRRSHQGGVFLSDSVLRLSDSRKMEDLLGRVSGLMKVHEGSKTFAASGRSSGGGGPVFLSAKTAQVESQPNWCFVSVFRDGVKIFQAPRTQFNEPPDLSNISVVDLGGVEYYAGGASMPPQFNGTSSSCGTLLLWSRER